MKTFLAYKTLTYLPCSKAEFVKKRQTKQMIDIKITNDTKLDKTDKVMFYLYPNLKI